MKLQFSSVSPVMSHKESELPKERKFYFVSYDEKRLILDHGRPTPNMDLSKEKKDISGSSTVSCMKISRCYVEIFQIGNCTAGRVYYFQKKTVLNTITQLLQFLAMNNLVLI